MSTTITVRPPATPSEIDAFFRLAAQTFVRDVPLDVAAPDWRRFTTGHPGFHPEDVRGAFRGDAYMGGYIIEERWLCVGPARVRVGGIGAVVTHPDYRHQGIGSALMRDAIDHARARGLSLLLLNGLLHFYDPFGYIDVFDPSEHAIARADVRALPASPYQVRPATPDDAPALLALYQRHYGSYTGSSGRTPDEQAFVVHFAQTVDRARYARRDVLPYDAPLLAVDGQGEPRGYLTLPWGPLRFFGCEAAADDWPAALALLQRHAALLDTLPEPRDDVRWMLPPDAPTLHAIVDHLPVRSVASQRPHAGWMACAVDVYALAQAMLPAWQERQQHRPNSWAGVLELAVEGDALALEISPADVRLLESSSVEARRVTLSRAVFVQLLFGYRPVSWAASQPDQQIPGDLIPILDALFPPGRTWIAPTDGC